MILSVFLVYVCAFVFLRFSLSLCYAFWQMCHFFYLFGFINVLLCVHIFYLFAFIICYCVSFFLSFRFHFTILLFFWSLQKRQGTQPSKIWNNVSICQRQTRFNFNRFVLFLFFFLLSNNLTTSLTLSSITKKTFLHLYHKAELFYK